MIKKGETYICTNDMYMKGEAYKPIYKKGKVYQSDTDGSLVDECNDTHYWSDKESFEKYFKKCVLPIKNSSDDRVNHPSHYTWLKKLCGIEVIDITRHMDFCLGNAIKYILRAGHKQEASLTDNQKEIEDLKKAIFYINDRIAQIEGKYDKDK